MTGSRASAAAVAAWVVFAGAAAAQAPGPPTPLIPSLHLIEPAAGPAPSEPPHTAPGRTDLPVSVDRLAAVDPDSVGLLGDQDGGLGVDLWRGTPRATVVSLVQALPAPLELASMRALERRLLLTTAAAPDGRADDVPLLVARARKLVELGSTAEAVNLIRVAPGSGADERLAQLEVEALFFANDNPGACARVRGVDVRSAYWQQALAYCLALAGEGEKASMIADLLRERGSDAPPAFFALMDAIGGDRNAKVDLAGDPGALTLVMMRTAKRKLPESVARSGRAAVLRVVALSPNADLGPRLAAAERAAAFGAISAADLAEFHAGVSFTSDEVANASTSAEAQWGPRARALLLRAALAQNAPAARLEVLRKAWQLGRDKGGLAAVRQVMAPALMGVEPAPETLGFAADAGVALYALGRAKEASAWYAAVEQAASGNPEAARAWTVLWPLSRLATKPAEWDPSLVTRWRAAQSAGGDNEAARLRAATIFALFDGLGQPVPPEAWTGLMRGGQAVDATLPDPAVLYALDRAARDGRRGETVALALIAIGPRGPAAAHPLTLSSVIGALVRAGLEPDARSLALEAATGG